MKFIDAYKNKFVFLLIITVLTIHIHAQSPFEKKGMWGISFGANLFLPESMNTVGVDFCPSVDHPGKFSWYVLKKEVQFIPSWFIELQRKQKIITNKRSSNYFYLEGGFTLQKINYDTKSHFYGEYYACADVPVWPYTPGFYDYKEEGQINSLVFSINLKISNHFELTESSSLFYSLNFEFVYDKYMFNKSRSISSKKLNSLALIFGYSHNYNNRFLPSVFLQHDIIGRYNVIFTEQDNSIKNTRFGIALNF
jgi:hypothetical protein